MLNPKPSRTSVRRPYIASAIIVAFFSATCFWLVSGDGHFNAAASGGVISGPHDSKQERPAQARAPVKDHDALHAAQEQASVYDPRTPLSPQLSLLRRLSDRQDPYATCILAFALDLCARGPDRMIVADYAFADPASLDEKSISRIAENLEFRERYANTCAGLEEGNLADMDRRLLQSALMGNVASMTRFSLLPFRPGSSSEDPKSEFALAYRKNAETMLNRAAEAGDPEAIRGVYYAYSLGYITSAMGTLEVGKDQVKSLAALRTTSHGAETEDGKTVKQILDREMARMSADEVSRFWRLTSLYGSSATYSTTDTQHGERVLDDFPEKACAARS